MKTDERIVGRLRDLVEVGTRLLGTRMDTADNIRDLQMAAQWSTSCLALLKSVFGQESDYYERFLQCLDRIDIGYNARMAFGVLSAAKDDYEKGALFNTRRLIQAELFDDFLEQAEHLFGTGYYGPAAVVAGAVLEDGLRKLCAGTGIILPANPKLDSMNAELAKANVYTTLTQKRITANADVRNKAAHGKWDEFKKADVEDMIRSIRSFMEDHFA